MIAKFNILLIILFFISLNQVDLSAQEEIKKDTIATSMEEALISPLDIKVLDLRKQKLKVLPNKFDRLINVHTIYLDKNKLDELPESFSACRSLRYLSISKNKFDKFPEVICQLTQLRFLDFSTNEIVFLPNCISQLIHLEEIYLVGNEVSAIPQSFFELDIKELDMRMIQMSEIEQERIREILPKTEIRFSKPCNCFEEEDDEEDLGDNELQ